MLDKECLKTVIETERKRYVATVERLNKAADQGSETWQQYYERRERIQKGRVEGMEDLLYDLGYLVLHLPNGDIDIIEMVDNEKK